MKQNENEMDERIAIGDEAIFSGHEELESRKCSNKMEPHFILRTIGSLDLLWKDRAITNLH